MTSDYDFMETPPEKKVKLLPLMNPFMKWGKTYRTIYYLGNVPIRGKDWLLGRKEIVLQMWKGTLPSVVKFLYGYGVTADHAGAVGAEIGLYHLIPGTGQWAPLFEKPQIMSYTLIHPTRNEELFFEAPPKKAWWRHKWMTKGSWERYKEDTPGALANPANYILNWTIKLENGKLLTGSWGKQDGSQNKFP